MELKIYNPQADGFLQKIDWNFEELKSEPSPQKVYSAKADASYHNEKSFLGAKFIESDFSPKARELYEKIMSGAYLNEN